jgi:hypothetical protein
MTKRKGIQSVSRFTHRVSRITPGISFVISHSSLVIHSSIIPAQFMLSPAVGSRYQTITRMIFGAKL